MSIVIDCTSAPSSNAMRMAGVTGICRYLAPTNLSKVIHKAEYDRLVHDGFTVVLNWEFDAYDWLGGAGRGVAHAAEAVRQARLLGYPEGGVIPGSADFDMSLSQWNGGGKAYASAYRDVIVGGGYRPGVYSGWDVLTWCRDIGFQMFWQSMSTGFSGGRNRNPWPGVHLWQRGHVNVGGIDCDRNDIMRVDYQGDRTVLKDEKLITRDINALQALDDLWNDMVTGKSGFVNSNGSHDVHAVNQQLNDILSVLTGLNQVVSGLNQAVTNLSAISGGLSQEDRTQIASLITSLDAVATHLR